MFVVSFADRPAKKILRAVVHLGATTTRIYCGLCLFWVLRVRHKRVLPRVSVIVYFVIRHRERIFFVPFPASIVKVLVWDGVEVLEIDPVRVAPLDR